MSPFYKQYLLSSVQLTIPEMREIQLEDGKWLYVGEDLKVRSDEGRYTLGLAFSGTDIQENGTTLRELSWHWTGKWLLFDDNELITDACGLMAAFYHENEKGWYVSSSLAVMQSVLKLERIGKINKTRLTWAIIPDTIVEGVKKLLPTQKIRFNGEKLEILFDNWIKDYRALSLDEKCDKVINSLTHAISNIAAEQKPIYLTLTGGKDCRVVFGCALKAGVPFHCFTFAHDHIQRNDKIVPKRIAKQYGVPYEFIKGQSFSQEKYNDYCEFVAYNSLGADAEFYAKNVFEALPKGAFMLKGGMFEAAQTYGRSLMENSLEGLKLGFEKYYGAYLQDANTKKAWETYYNWVEENPIPWLDIRDRLYLEQRCSAWVAALEQSLDITGVNSIQVVNSAEMLSALLSATEEERQNLQFAYNLLRLCDSKLLEFPINKKYPIDKFWIIVNGVKRRLFRK